MDGQNGTISSGSFIKPHISDDQKDNSGSGMLIDLDGNDTDKSSSALYAYGSGGAFELNTDKKHPLLRIKSGPYVNSSIMFNIGYGDNPEFYLQSSNFVENKSGTKFNLKDGTLSIFHDNGSYLKMRGDGSPYFQIHDSGTATDGHVEGTDIFYAGLNKYELMSTNFISGTAGIFIDLYNGSIEARKGNIGGWAINAGTLSAGSIILNSDGSMSGGTTYKWSISKNGSAIFNNIAANAGTIGPFTVNSDGLSYSTIFSLTKDGLNYSNNFIIGSNGDATINGSLTVNGSITVTGKANLNLEGTQTVSGTITPSSGGGYYSLGSNSATLGPWTVDNTGIYTKYSFLGAQGTLSLKASESNGLVVASNTTKIEYGSAYMGVQDGSARMTSGNDTLYVYVDNSMVQLKGGGALIQLKDGEILLQGKLIMQDKNGYSGNVVFLDGSYMTFENGILVAGKVADKSFGG